MSERSEARAASVCLAIPTYGREDVLVETLRQVLMQVPAPDQIMVIDQSPRHKASTEAFLVEACRRHGVEWIRLERANVNAARNEPLRRTWCDVVLYIDDDVTLKEGLVTAHRRHYADPAIVAVAGRAVQAKGLKGKDGTSPWVRELGYAQFSIEGTEPVRGVASFIGANHSVRVSAARALGGYDEEYVGPIFDESDLALGLVKEGGTIVFDPKAEVFHLQAPSGGWRHSGRVPAYKASFSSVYFYLRHFWPSWYGIKQIVWGQFRRRVLTRENVTHFWRLPRAVWGYGQALLIAFRLCRKPRKRYV